MPVPLDRARMLVLVKVLHTVVWAFFVGCIIAIPIAAALHQPNWARALAGIMFVECGVILFNRGRCPLTDIAARYTDDRAANFDIYLPLWLAQHNQVVFGSIFVVDVVFLVWRSGGI